MRGEVGFDTRRLPAGEKHRYQALDGIRGVAALVIVIFHFQAYNHVYMLNFIRNAHLFVDLFFVLSGFVIAYAYATRLRNWPDYADYAVRRIGRVWPLHITMLIAFVVVELAAFVVWEYKPSMLPRPPFSEDRPVAAIIPNIFLLNGVGLFKHATWNAPSWSISAEIAVNLLFGLMVISFRRRIEWVAAVMIILSIYVLYMYSEHYISTDSEFAVFRCLYGFLMGFVAYLVHKGIPVRGTLAEISISATVVLFVAMSHDGPIQLFAPLVFVVAIIIFANGAGKVSALLRSIPLQTLGRLSFSIYMIHMFIAFIIFNLIKAIGKVAGIAVTLPDKDLIFIHSQWAMDGLTLLYIGVVLVVARYSYKWIEVRGIQLSAALARKVHVTLANPSSLRRSAETNVRQRDV